jgi:hypothetical protein
MALSDPEEERLVAELELLGIRYLSRQTPEHAASVRPPADLLAGLIRQPSARVRTAVIAVLLSHPDLAEVLPAALERLSPPEQQTLLFFYTAAVLLQQQYAPQLQSYVGWQPLPDRFAVDLGLPSSIPIRERLVALGQRQRQQTGKTVNWTGTYEQVVRHLLRSWELQTQLHAVDRQHAIPSSWLRRLGRGTGAGSSLSGCARSPGTCLSSCAAADAARVYAERACPASWHAPAEF